ncbi:MAG: hypothetical protein KAS95_05695, partial [Candidatus Heimdallarchaeota archaeon]|nr:hypothetical protein [Candidatus Heimdallarchaeota archaeon]
GNDSDYQISLRGNLYMATALLQQSAYQYYYGDMYMSDYYFFLAEAIEIASIPSIFLGPKTNLFHTSYNLTSSSLSPFAFTYENCIALSQYTEFYRASYDRWGIPPDFYALAILYEKLKETVFEEPLFFRGGITSALSPIFLNWQEIYLNPLIVNYQAITMLTKFFPIIIDLVTPGEVSVGEEIVFDWVIDNSETTSIFGSSFALLPKDLEIHLSLTIDANISDVLTLPLITTILDGVRLFPSLYEQLNFTSFQGGHQELKIEATRSSFIVLEHTHKFYITKLIGIITEPTNIEFIEGYDERIFFAILCHDEDGIGIDNANVNFTINEEVLYHTTDTSGYVYVELPIEIFLPDNQEEFLQAQDEFSAISTNITIMASKVGYFSKITEKTIKILRNSLILTISPSPPSVKEGSNLPISLSVESSIQANVQSPKARIYISNVLQNSTSGVNQFNLPTSIILSTSKIREDSELSIIITSGNFKPTWFNMSLQFTLLGTLERIYTWFEYLLQSDIAKILGSLGVLWVIMFKQFRLRVLRSIQRCPYCGETMKRKYSVCRYCGEILNREKYDVAKEKTRPKQMEMEN